MKKKLKLKLELKRKTSRFTIFALVEKSQIHQSKRIYSTVVTKSELVTKLLEIKYKLIVRNFENNNSSTFQNNSPTLALASARSARKRDRDKRQIV